MKKCPVCNSDMERKSKTVKVDTMGTIASGSDYTLLSSSSPQAPLGTPMKQEYWLCSKVDCRTVVEN